MWKNWISFSFCEEIIKEFHSVHSLSVAWLLKRKRCNFCKPLRNWNVRGAPQTERLTSEIIFRKREKKENILHMLWRMWTVNSERERTICKIASKVLYAYRITQLFCVAWLFRFEQIWHAKDERLQLCTKCLQPNERKKRIKSKH